MEIYMEMGQIGACLPTMATNRVCITEPSSNPAFVRIRNSYQDTSQLLARLSHYPFLLSW